MMITMISLYNKIYNKALPALFKFFVFFTPLIFIANTNEVFEFPKTYFLYVVGGTLIWLFSIKKVLNAGSPTEKIIWPNFWISGFVAIYILSTIFSSHWATSLFGYYTRFNGSLISILIFYGLYIVLINEFQDYQIKQLLEIVMISSLITAVYAFFQHFGFVTNFWKSEPTERAFSTLGQPNWLAAYLAALLPMFLYATFDIDNKYEKDDPVKNVLFGGFYLITDAAIWFTYSLSGIFGSIIGVLGFLALNWKQMSKKLGGFFILILMGLGIAITNPGIFEAKMNDVYMDLQRFYKNTIEVQAAENTIPINTTGGNAVSDPGYIRLSLWKGTLDLFKSSPKIMLIGSGPETFAYEFQKFRPTELNESSEWNFVFNKPHNYYLELLTNIGIFGLLFYVGILFWAIKQKNPLYTPGILALMVTNFFGWPTVATAMLFWLFLAGIEKDK